MPRWLTKRGLVWHYRFSAGGRPFYGSTGATDLTTARLVLEEARRQAILMGIGQGKAPTLGLVAREWIAAKKGTVSAAHIRNAEHTLEALGKLAKLPVDRITDQVFQTWRSEYLQDHSRAYVNLHTRILKAWLKSALADRSIREMPCNLKPLKEQERRRPVVTDWRSFVAKAESRVNPQVRPAIILCMMLGLRVSEMVQARWEWIEGDTFIVGGRTKSRKIRSIHIPKVVMQELHALAGPELPNLGLIFPNREGKPYGTTWLRMHLVKAGIPGVHRLRATFATLLLRDKTNPKDVQEMLGHSSIVTTMKYSEGSMETKRKAQENLWA